MLTTIQHCDIVSVLNIIHHKGENEMNYNLLKGAIAAKGFTQADLAAKIGISPTSLSYKMNGLKEWKSMELKAIKNVLELDDATFVSIFFADNVE